MRWLREICSIVMRERDPGSSIEARALKYEGGA
jgi:hypothetical protein